MPIYEFTCKACGEDFEALCRVGQPAEEGCPTCGSRRIAKHMSTFVGKSNDSPVRSAPVPSGGGGHCCGAGCRCH